MACCKVLLPMTCQGNKKKPMTTASPVHSGVHSIGTQVSMATQPHYGHSLLKDARKDNLYLCVDCLFMLTSCLC